MLPDVITSCSAALLAFCQGIWTPLPWIMRAPHTSRASANGPRGFAISILHSAIHLLRWIISASSKEYLEAWCGLRPPNESGSLRLVTTLSPLSVLPLGLVLISAVRIVQANGHLNKKCHMMGTCKMPHMSVLIYVTCYPPCNLETLHKKPSSSLTYYWYCLLLSEISIKLFFEDRLSVEWGYFIISTEEVSSEANSCIIS